MELRLVSTDSAGYSLSAPVCRFPLEVDGVGIAAVGVHHWVIKCGQASQHFIFNTHLSATTREGKSDLLCSPSTDWKHIKRYCGCMKVIYGAVRSLLDHRGNTALPFVPLCVWQSSRIRRLYCRVQIVGFENTSTCVPISLKKKKTDMSVLQTEILPGHFSASPIWLFSASTE